MGVVLLSRNKVGKTMRTPDVDSHVSGGSVALRLSAQFVLSQRTPMADTLHRSSFTPIASDRKSLAKLYDEHAAVVLGFLEKLADDRDKAEELLQAVFLALPSRLNEFDAYKGRFVVWLLSLARGIAQQQQQESDNFQTNGGNLSTEAIRRDTENVPFTHARPLMPGNGLSVVELLYMKGYTFAQAAAELGVDVPTVQLMVRTELKKYRR